MSARLAVIPVVVALCSVGCRPRGDLTREAQAREAQALLARDREWAQLVSAGKNADSILSYWTEDARVVSPGQATLEGKRAIQEMVTQSLANPAFHISWTPEAAVVSRSGDLGYTYGSNQITIPGPAAKTTTIAGRYLTVWRKDADGQWRCVMDYSTPEPDRPAPPAGTD